MNSADPARTSGWSRAQNHLAGRAAAHRARLNARQEEVVLQFLRRASVMSERAVCWARLAVCALALVRLVLVFGERLVAGELKALFALVGLTTGSLLSLLAFVRLDPERPRPVHDVVSVLLDWFVATTVLAPIVLWPHDGYQGFLREVDHAGYYMVVVAAGLRLTDRAVFVGVAINGLTMFALVTLDGYLWGARVTYPASDVALMGIYLLGTSLLAVTASRYTRRLVRDGSAQSLAAERARQRLGVYVSEAVTRSLDDEPAPNLGGSRTQIAVLFSDLRGFTSYSEQHDPESVVAELNAYLAHMVEVIHDEGGLVDKYIGDAIMAVYGLEEEHGSNPALGAIRSAAAMERVLLQHNASRLEEGLPALAHGVGVHFGNAVAGNIGTFDRMQYTVVGDAVNTASRIEGATKEHGHHVLISRAAGDAARDGADAKAMPALRSVGTIAIRGRVGKVEVYTLAEQAAALPRATASVTRAP